MKYLKIHNIILIVCLWGSRLLGQDRSNGLFLGHPQVLTPSFAGLVEGKFNLRATHRSQTVAQSVYSTNAVPSKNTLISFNQTVFSANLPINHALGNGGLGVLLITETTDALRTNVLQFNGAYQVPLPASVRYDHFRVGVNVGLIQRTLIDGNYYFEDQFRGRDFSGQTQERFNGLSTAALDMGIGLHWHRTQKIKGNPEFTPFAGIALNHITRPVLGFFANSEDPLAMRTVLIAGFKQRTRTPIDFNLGSMLVLSNQATHWLLNFQARYTLYEDNVLFGNELLALIGGVTYRQNLSIAPLLGLEYKKSFSLGLTYEIMTDPHRLIGQTAGGYQVFLGYTLDPTSYKGTAMPFSNF